MKCYNTIELIRQIQDKELFESVYTGFKTIYESNSTVAIDEMEHDTYPEALMLMDEHFNPITDKTTYSKELEHVAMDLFHVYNEHQKQMSDELDTLDFNELKLVMNTVAELMPQMTGENTFEDYSSILKDKIQIFVGLFGSPENMTRVLNEWIKSEKFNALYHRIKDRFIPQMNNLK